MKLAIVHDHLNQRGGAERVVEVLHEMFPDAPIFTSIVDRSMLWPGLANADIRPSWMQKLPGWKKHFKKYLPFYPKAIESFDLREYDLVLSSSSAFAKGALKRNGALHICYCYTPMRFVWDFENYVAKENLPWIFKRCLPFFIRRLRKWDVTTSSRPDLYIAISSEVRRRIRSCYGIDARVIFPPVDTQRYKPEKKFENFYLVVSRLASYKRIDLVVQAFNHLGLPLKIIGSGPYENELKVMAKPNVEFLGRLADPEVAHNYASCKAFIFPGCEDFGLAPLEANAAGRPVIAFKGGGALDTVIEGVNGIFFTEPSVASLSEAIMKMENGRFAFSPQRIRDHALQFDTSVFIEKFRSLFAEINFPLPIKVQGVRKTPV
jgi:glycosyltransferase involved in cell wall biosynthesis